MQSEPIDDDDDFRPSLNGAVRKLFEKLKPEIEEQEDREFMKPDKDRDTFDLGSFDWRNKGNRKFDTAHVFKAALQTALDNPENFRRRLKGREPLDGPK